MKLSFGEKCAYGVGDMACNLFWGLIVLSGVFYTDYFGIAPRAAALMMLIVRCLDITFDVFIGAVADRRNTKYGRFRPWLLYGVVPFCVIGFFTFYTPDFSEPAKLAYAYGTYLLFMLMYSVVNVPYGALMGVISEDPKERTEVSAFRNIFAQIGCLVVYGTLFSTVAFFQKAHGMTPQKAFSSVVFIYAVIVFFSLLATFFFTRERVAPIKEEKNKLSDDVKDLIANRPWITLTIAGIMLLVFIFCHNGLTAYYAKYFVANTEIQEQAVIIDIQTDANNQTIYILDNEYIDYSNNARMMPVGNDTIPVERSFLVQNETGEYVNIAAARGAETKPQVGDTIAYFINKVSGRFLGFELNWEILLTFLLSISSVVTIIGTLLIRPVVAHFGKKPTWIGCFVLASLTSVVFYFVPKESLGTIIILQTLFTLFIGPAGFIMWSMYADVADYAEVKTGRRATGLIFSSATMAQKLGATLANTLPLFVLASIGFIANDLTMTLDTRHTIRAVFALFPLVGAVVAIIALCFYNINEDMIQENSAKLTALKAGKGNTIAQ
ncbi:MAG: MFS transporter [Bacteroidales bacterium]|jgi:GPH family glycoside/pentoside/hexuronide:cation symporter|nr:MFS transporter [Bacteroidales bacterium]